MYGGGFSPTDPSQVGEMVKRLIENRQEGVADLAGIIVASALLKTAAPGTSTRIAAPVLMLQGTQDRVSPMDVVLALVAEMDAAGNDFRVELYGGTHHAFDNPDAGTDPKARLVYSPAAAARSLRAIGEFLRERTRA